MLYFSGKGCSEFPKKVLILIGILTQKNLITIGSGSSVRKQPDRFLFHLLQILCLLHLQRFRSHTGINLLDLLQQIL